MLKKLIRIDQAQEILSARELERSAASELTSKISTRRGVLETFGLNYHNGMNLYNGGFIPGSTDPSGEITPLEIGLLCAVTAVVAYAGIVTINCIVNPCDCSPECTAGAVEDCVGYIKMGTSAGTSYNGTKTCSASCEWGPCIQ